ncbi:MAG TPA: biotin carboxylase N-terminal domain-containing protein [Candidatus Lumbricidophila sp.]|nr:biotin carboxylase N-terminal domain-containing protein [Candidatus Lumbricidophila sp.]
MPIPLAPGPRPFDRVLVANRGEIAVRIIGTLRRLGIASVAVYSDADASALHTRLADHAVHIGPAAATESYLNIDRLVAAAVASGAQAVHPGYGFVSENADFARACAAAGLVFIGPSAEALEVMGDKIAAKRQVERVGVPTLPGVADPTLDDAGLVRAGTELGFPLLVKPAAGGGGKGMRIVRDADELAAALPGARRIASAAFADDALLLERYLERARHIELQVLADEHRNIVHLGERECSLQRRHQKVIEESPSPIVTPELRARLGTVACVAAASVQYTGVGTVEFLVPADDPSGGWFIEMNTRLQVEHPVTELVTGIDLVEAQLRVAAGQPLWFGQDDVALTGHAIEARIYAEAPTRGFLPATGEVLVWQPPTGTGVRVDSGIETGSIVTANYDPMLAKVITHGADRPTALARLEKALADLVVLGVEHNTDSLRDLVRNPLVQRGDLDTGLIERIGWPVDTPPSDAEFAIAAAVRFDADAPPPTARAWTRLRDWRLSGDTAVAPTLLEPPAQGADAPREPATALAADGSVWVHHDRTVRVPPSNRAAAVWARVAATIAPTTTDPELRSPLPGTVTAVFVTDGATVAAGDPVIAVEAMKLEHRVLAPAAGRAELLVEVGAQVRQGALVARVHAEPPADHPAHPADPGSSEPAAPNHPTEAPPATKEPSDALPTQ